MTAEVSKAKHASKLIQLVQWCYELKVKFTHCNGCMGGLLLPWGSFLGLGKGLHLPRPGWEISIDSQHRHLYMNPVAVEP